LHHSWVCFVAWIVVYQEGQAGNKQYFDGYTDVDLCDADHQNYGESSILLLSNTQACSPPVVAFSPLINLYSKSILHCYDQIGMREYIVFFTPLIILVIGLLPLLTADKDHLVTLLLNHQIDNNLRVVAGISVVYNVYYLYNTLVLLKKASQSEGIATVQQSYYAYILSLLLISLMFTLLLITALIISLFLNTSQRSALDTAVKICWLALCLYPLTITWFVITRQELFSTLQDRSKGKSKESLSDLKIKLDELMESKKPFLDPELSLNDLSGLLHTDPHILSRLINEDDATNFYDFINGYRIHEFKNRCEQGQHRAMTSLPLPMMLVSNLKPLSIVHSKK
jgi:hypothetical protein